ncbi:hypothetical protein M5D96_001374 [Drosophila gunungcola]|uniref:Uncharacterized protein n=1 Tax=Drosophila gunungcola TaxID=103775 RepID=A0A9P9YYU3_9MUSC|nr:hypothetical protein M5D96_001374 [Drosophila gunungcola]
MRLARSWNYYCATHSPTSVIADSAQLTKPNTVYDNAETRWAATPSFAEGHPAQNPAIRSACREFDAVVTPRVAPL